jgi:hypothetical protein
MIALRRGLPHFRADAGILSQDSNDGTVGVPGHLPSQSKVIPAFWHLVGEETGMDYAGLARRAGF